MAMKPVKNDKNVYRMSREAAKLTREAASEQLFISPDRIEKIEMRGAAPHPDEVLAMSTAYKDPVLCNYYCSHECETGKVCVPEVQAKDVSQITLEMLANLNKMSKVKDRLIEITVDGVISEEELKDFKEIKDTLGKMSTAIESLTMWVSNSIVSGRMKDPDDGLNQ